MAVLTFAALSLTNQYVSAWLVPEEESGRDKRTVQAPCINMGERWFIVKEKFHQSALAAARFSSNPIPCITLSTEPFSEAVPLGFNVREDIVLQQFWSGTVKYPVKRALVCFSNTLVAVSHFGETQRLKNCLNMEVPALSSYTGMEGCNKRLNTMLCVYTMLPFKF